ncbi:response regulator [Hoeflea sp. AS60]|uniref:response regulator n=1 Tax=Hoeflea sp. AS60 TaxID=3135780 RepID=UPI00316C960C
MSGPEEETRILIIEDNADDAELLLRALKQGGQAAKVEIATDFASAADVLPNHAWDIVLSDYNLPRTHFSDILDLVKTKDPDLPVIVVSGAVGEEVAVSLMRDGASDLILKHNLSRLVPAIRRELKAAEQKRARRESDIRFRDMVVSTADWVWETDRDHRLSLDIAGRDQAEWAAPLRSLKRTHCEAVQADPEHDQNWREHLRTMDSHKPFHDFRFGFQSPNGQEYHVSMNGIPVFDRDGEFAGYRGTATDETLIVETYLRAEVAEAQLREAIEALAQGFVIVDASDQIIGVNDAYRKLYPELSILLRTGNSWSSVIQKMTELDLVQGRTPCPATDAAKPVDSVWQLASGKQVLVSEGSMLGGGWTQLQTDITTFAEAWKTL